MEYPFNFDFNAFPFKLRFSTSNKIYHEIQNISDELFNAFQKMNIEIRDKTEIKNILRENFAFVGQVLRNILNYYNSSTCLIETAELKFDMRKQMEEKLLYYCEDEQESICFDKTKETIVEVYPIPANWKCLTWQKFALSKMSFIQSHPADRLKQISIDEMNNDHDQQFDKDLEDIYSSINALNHRIQVMKNKINLLNEHIVWLYFNIKEYLKVLVKFNQTFPGEVEETSFDPLLQGIKSDIAKLFEIELKIDFFSNSPTAYELDVTEDSRIRLELKPFDSLMVAAQVNNVIVNVNTEHQLHPSVICISNSDPKNLVTLNNYMGDIYIDPNHIHSYPATSSIQQ